MKILDFDYISGLNIPPAQVYEWCNEVWRMKDDCVLPPKVKMWQGESGRYITMPCVIPQIDVGGVKFISRNVDDVNGIPARNSNIMIQNCSKMGLLAVTDGIWITNMRTGAIAAHSVVSYSKSSFHTLGMMGLGLAAWSFMYVFGAVYHGGLKVKLLRHKEQAESFIRRFSEQYPQFDYEIVDSVEEVCGCDTVVSAVSYARDVFADLSVYQPGCLIVPIHTAGFQNCDLGFDRIIIDDHGHVKGFKYYEQFKAKTVEMSKIENGLAVGRQNDDERIIAYCGGIALHDIYIAWQIYKLSEKKGDAPDFPMHFPQEHLWV